MYDAGIMKVYSVSNSAANGHKPTKTYTLKATLAYDERVVGAIRYSAAMQTDNRLSAIVRTPRTYDALPDDVAVLEPYSHTDGTIYKIYQVQQTENENFLPVSDFSLERLEGINANEVIPSG